MNWLTALKLGRVSNLPTVWTNTLAGTLLAGGILWAGSTLLVLLSMTLFYIGGMFLNDAFDAEIDARERPERPIPSGQVARSTVMICGLAMLLLGELLLLSVGVRAALAGLVLGAAILGYNYHHKNNPFSPLLMGVCRMCIYLAAGFAVTASLPLGVLAGASILLCYLIGLTYAAKQENLGQITHSWPLVCLAVPIIYALVNAGDNWLTWVLCLALTAWIVMAVRFIMGGKPGGIPKGVVSLIAGISLLDAVLISTTGSGTGVLFAALLAVLGFGLTLLFQRYIPGT